MGEKSEYSLELNWFIKYSIWGLPALTLLIIIISLVNIKITNTVLIMLIPLLALALWNWTRRFHRPVKIEVYQDHAILYNIYRMKTKMMFKDIFSIESSDKEILILRLNSKKIYKVNGFSNFSKFVEDAKRKNKDILLKGL